MAISPHAADFQGSFSLFFSFLSFKTALIFPKVVSREKTFSNFFVFGGSKRLDSSLTGGESTKRSQGKEDVGAVRKDDAFSLRNISP